jgi:YVTN family beta-propeller protein
MVWARSVAVGLVLVACPALTHAEFAFLPDPLRSTVLVIDPASAELKTELPSHAPSRDVVYDRDRKRLSVADTGWLAEHTTEPGTVTVWQVPDDMELEAASPAGALLNSFEVVTRIPTGVSPVDLALDEERTRLYVANSGNDTLTVVDVGTDEVVGTIDLSGMPSGVTVLPDTGLLFVSRQRMDDVVVVGV